MSLVPHRRIYQFAMLSVACMAGTYRGSSMAMCTICDTNTISAPGAAICTDCDPGTVSNEDRTGCGKFLRFLLSANFNKYSVECRYL